MVNHTERFHQRLKVDVRRRQAHWRAWLGARPVVSRPELCCALGLRDTELQFLIARGIAPRPIGKLDRLPAFDANATSAALLRWVHS